MESGYAETNGQKLYYEVHGEGEPLVLIMGLGSDSTGWLLQLPELAEHFKVITFDNRDVGRSSEATGAYTIADMAADTAGLMEALAIERAHILGGSMGGAIAQELVLNYPEKVNKLILASTMGHFARFKISFLEPIKFIKIHDTKNEIFPIEIMMWCMTHDFLKDAQAVEPMVSMMKNSPFPQSTEAFCRQTDAMRTFDVLDRLQSVKAPTLVMVGSQDILTPPWSARELAEAIPGAQLQIIEGGAHGFCWEIPEKANKAVLEFLRQ